MPPSASAVNGYGVGVGDWTAPPAFPNSSKVYAGGRHGIRVPMREIALSGGEPPLRVYDTSGPLGGDVRQGLPSLRGEWIAAREVSSVSRSYTPIAGRSTAELPA